MTVTFCDRLMHDPSSTLRLGRTSSSMDQSRMLLMQSPSAKSPTAKRHAVDTRLDNEKATK